MVGDHFSSRVNRSVPAVPRAVCRRAALPEGRAERRGL